jgi:hypothetical protein
MFIFVLKYSKTEVFVLFCWYVQFTHTLIDKWICTQFVHVRWEWLYHTPLYS